LPAERARRLLDGQGRPYLAKDLERLVAVQGWRAPRPGSIAERRPLSVLRIPSSDFGPQSTYQARLNARRTSQDQSGQFERASPVATT
jgi:hypothetical protein